MMTLMMNHTRTLTVTNDDWSQPSGEDEDDHGNYMPPDDDDAESTNDDPGDPVDDNLADGSSDDECTGDFDVHANSDDNTEPACPGRSRSDR